MVEDRDAAMLASTLMSVGIPPALDLLASMTASGSMRYADGKKEHFKVFSDTIALFLESGRWFEIDELFRVMTMKRN